MTSHAYDRRTVLRAVGATAVGVSVAGCLGSGGPDGTVLPPPENYERSKDLDLPYPRYGEELPEATVPAPLHDREVTTTEFVGDRHAMLTFLYTSCVTVCPGLMATLRRVQADSIEEGYADEFAFMPITFDPEQDTPEAIAEYCDAMGVNREVDNWYFLRPETPDRAKAVVEETFGVAFEGGEMEGGHGGGDGGGHGGNGDMGSARHFQHAALILLVNEDGIVERAYNGGPPETGTASDDARTLVEEW
jgi:protein SCO1/2